MKKVLLAMTGFYDSGLNKYTELTIGLGTAYLLFVTGMSMISLDFREGFLAAFGIH